MVKHLPSDRFSSQWATVLSLNNFCYIQENLKQNVPEVPEYHAMKVWR